MKAYHGNAELKMMMVADAIEHQTMDRLRQSFGYGRALDDDGDPAEFRGCAVGCTIWSVNRKRGEHYQFNDHQAYEPALGIPRVLARIEDGIFEGLPKDVALTWPHRFLAAVPVGADLSGVIDQFMHWLLVDENDGVIRFAKKEQARAAIQAVGNLYAKKIRGETVTQEEWQAARKNAAADAYADADAYAAAAYAAAAYAADAYAADAYAADAYAADAYAAYAYAADAYAADAYAADAADAADADADADADAPRQKARVRQSKKLLDLLTAAPVAMEEATA